MIFYLLPDYLLVWFLDLHWINRPSPDSVPACPNLWVLSLEPLLDMVTQGSRMIPELGPVYTTCKCTGQKISLHSLQILIGIWFPAPAASMWTCPWATRWCVWEVPAVSLSVNRRTSENFLIKAGQYINATPYVSELFEISKYGTSLVFLYFPCSIFKKKKYPT